MQSFEQIFNTISGQKRTRKRQRQKDLEGTGDRDRDRDYRHEEHDQVDEEAAGGGGGGGEDSEEERIVGDLNSHISFTIETKEKSKCETLENCPQQTCY